MRRHLPILALTLLAALPLHASERTSFHASASSRLVLEGSSNVAAWRCSGTTLDGRMEVAAPLTRINAAIDQVEDGALGRWLSNPSAALLPQTNFQLRIPVSTLRCGNGRMERDMYRALRSEEHPSIQFRFEKLVGLVRYDLARGSYRATAAGVLSLAGTDRNVHVEIEARRVGTDQFRLRARLPLRMTEFRITPPTALFGAIRANDALTVEFDLLLRAGAGAKASL